MRILLVAGVAWLAVAALACGGESGPLLLTTTTSTADSGLLDALLPDFEEEAGVTVQVLAVGTGRALAFGERGDVDVILVHDPARERDFVAAGFGVMRRDVMFNDFVILGPADDPAGIAVLGTAADAFDRIAEAGVEGAATFVSRGDGSGTHGKELAVWQSASIDPGGGWYNSTGQGMGNTLTVANELLAYTIADRGTYLSHQERLDIHVCLEGDPLLRNPYGVIVINPDRHPDIRYNLAVQFIEYLTLVETQERIGAFGLDKFGQALFHPDNQQWQFVSQSGGQ